MSLRKLGFKWFGSLTSLTFRRSTEKSDSNSSQSQPGAGARPKDGSTTPLAPLVEKTVDDMDGMRPRTSSYVRSSESYTHMGTLPRLLMKRRDKSTKEGSSSKKSKNKSSINRSQSQRPTTNQEQQKHRITATSLKDAQVQDNLDLSHHSSPDPHPKPETQNEPNIPNIISWPGAQKKDLSPSSGSNTTLQLEASEEQGTIQTRLEVKPVGSSSPLLNQGTIQSQIDGKESLESRPGPEPEEEEAKNTGHIQENLKPDNMSSHMDPAGNQANYAQVRPQHPCVP